MTCIAGSVDRPAPWVRFIHGEPVGLRGRICERVQPWTSKRACSSCPAFRGERWDTSIATGVAPDGETPLGLTLDEFRAYADALERKLVDDDDVPFAAWSDRMAANVPVGLQRRAHLLGDPDAQAVLAGRVRSWRAANPERARELNREHVRAYRERRKGCK